MSNVPADWPQLSPSLYYTAPAAAIDWLCAAFGFAVRIKIEGDDGAIHHSELTYGTALLMVSSATGRSCSPRDLDGRSTAALFLYVDDVDAHCLHAKAAGAEIVSEPKDSDYGPGYWTDRGYEARDCEGHRWYFAQRLRSN